MPWLTFASRATLFIVSPEYPSRARHRMVARTISARRSGATPRLGLMALLVYSWLGDQLSLSVRATSSAGCGRREPVTTRTAVRGLREARGLSLIHISEPTRLLSS